jgi:hypothetical protein
MELVQDIENVRKMYSELVEEIQTTDETQKEIANSVNEEINNVHRNFIALRNVVKQL